MSKKPDPARDRLMLAAMDARDLLRTLAPELGARRAEAEHVADLLVHALKDPGGSPSTLQECRFLAISLSRFAARLAGGDRT
jgi:hypothetical protein